MMKKSEKEDIFQNMIQIAARIQSAMEFECVKENAECHKMLNDSMAYFEKISEILDNN